MAKIDHRRLLIEEADAITDVHKDAAEELEARIEDFAPSRIQILIEEESARSSLWLKRKFFDHLESDHAKKIRKNNKHVLLNPDVAGHIASYLEDGKDVYSFSKSIAATVQWPFLLNYLHRFTNYGFEIDKETLTQIGDQLLEEWHRLNDCYITSLSAIRLRTWQPVKTHPEWSYNTTVSAWGTICTWIAKKGIRWFLEYLKNPIIVEPPEISPPLLFDSISERFISETESELLLSCDYEHVKCKCKMFNKALSPVIKVMKMELGYW